MNSYKFGVLREQMHVFHKTKKMNEALQDFSSTILYGPTDLQYESLSNNLLYLSVLLQYSTVATVSTLRFTLYAGGVAIYRF